MDTVTIQVERVAAETDLALLLVIDAEEVWVPKSCISDPDEIAVGDEEIEVNVAEWIAQREGLV